MSAAFKSLIAALVAVSMGTSLAAESSDTSVRRLVSLIDYIGGDYTEAVAGGKVINPAEYQEMLDFAGASATELSKINSRLPADAASEVQGNLTALKVLIEQKADVTAVRSLTLAIKNRILDSLAFNTTPTQTPKKHLAVKQFAQQCASCHGEAGGGDGPASGGMEPPPRNFRDAAVLEHSSPFKYYNATVLGIEGTSMMSYAQSLSDEERWSLAFYAMGMSRSDSGDDPEASWRALPSATRQTLIDGGLSLALLARQSDAELRAWLKNLKAIEAKQIEPTLTVLRTAAPYLPDLPQTAHVAQPQPSQPDEAARSATSVRSAPEQIAHVRAYIEEARMAFAARDGGSADAILLDAYLNAFEGLEAALAIRDKNLVTQVEQSFIAARQAARQGDSAGFNQHLETLITLLQQSETLLIGNRTDDSSATDFFASFVIILREGFEAFLIVGAMLALLRRSGADRKALRVVHAGWTSAIVAGFASYYLFLAVFDLTGAARETIEAVCTGAAAIVLFYVSFWLLNQAERGRWDGFVRNFADAANAKSKLGLLFFVAFIAVYREAAETVLFYTALAASADSMTSVALGFGSGVILLLAIVLGIIYWGIRIPMKRFFLLTSTAMIVLSVVLAGKTINELVEAGFIEPTRIAVFPTIDLLGIYPQWESLIVQFTAALAAALISYRQVALAKQQSRR